MRRFVRALLRREPVWITLPQPQVVVNSWGQGRYWLVLGTPPENRPDGGQVGGRVFLKVPLSRRLR